MNTNADPPNLTAAPLWERTRAMFARAVAAIGGAAAIAAIKLLTRATRRDIVQWLAPLEHVVRKLLLAEAAELRRAEVAVAARAPRVEVIALASGGWITALPPDFAAAKPARLAAARERVRSPRTQRPADLSRPETWRAHFSLSVPRDPLRCPEHRVPRILDPWGPPLPPPPPPPPPPLPPPRRQLDSAFRLARRFEALRRVLENPLPHARRLAALLVHIRRRFGEVVRRYLYAPMFADAYDPCDPRLGVMAICQASPALEVFDSS